MYLRSRLKKKKIDKRPINILLHWIKYSTIWIEAVAVLIGETLEGITHMQRCQMILKGRVCISWPKKKIKWLYIVCWHTQLSVFRRASYNTLSFDVLLTRAQGHASFMHIIIHTPFLKLIIMYWNIFHQHWIGDTVQNSFPF